MSNPAVPQKVGVTDTELESIGIEIVGSSDVKEQTRTMSISLPACALLSVIGVAVFSMQVFTAVLSTPYPSFDQRFASLGPAFVVSPWCSMALLYCLCRRGQHQAIAKCIWVSALACLLASVLCPCEDFIRSAYSDARGEAATSSFPTWAVKFFVATKLGEATWVCSYAVSEVVILIYLVYRVQQLVQTCSARYLTMLVKLQMLFLAAAFAPCPIVSWYPRSFLRLAVCLGFILIFIMITFIATRAMLKAADSAEVVAAAKLAKGNKILPGFYSAVHWTRWSAKVTLFTLLSSVLLQGSLYAWFLAGYQTFHWTRYVADWATFLDFGLNALALGCLAGAVGPSSVASDDAMQQVGAALLESSSAGGAGMGDLSQ